jgi:VWFA-related protein
VKPWFLLFVACTLCASIVFAQISVDVTLVTLVATVTDSTGRYVPNLGATDFTVVEDGKEQKIALVEQSNDLPLSIGVLLDASTSMRPKIQTATETIDRFLRTLGPSDDIFLMSFSGKPKLEQNFTNDRNKISKALHKVQLNSRTALYDTIEQGIAKVRDGKHPKKALLLVTDGQDTISSITLEQALDDVRQSHVLLYCLGIGSTESNFYGGAGIPQPQRPVGGRGGIPMILLPGGIQIPLPGPVRRQFPGGGPVPQGRYPGGGPYSGLETADMQVLDSLASASGAKAWLVSTNSENSASIMEDVLNEVGAELRSQYTIGYYPDHPVNDGKWHQVTVRTSNSRYDVRARKEYYGAGAGTASR